MELREWDLLDVLDKIPLRTFLKDVSITSIDAIPDLIAFATDCGEVLLYDRKKKSIQKLRTQNASSGPITVVRICDTVDFMLAAGNDTGQISIFQIHKDIPVECQNLPIPKQRGIFRYTVQDLHKMGISALAWSKNGMKLFSGDRRGIIVFTEIDYQLNITKSREIINESYEIVQICFKQSHLVVSSTFRTIVCHQEPTTGEWRVSQVGKKDRKALSKFGATLIGPKNKPLIITTRPSYRFWIADPTSGNVTQTLIFKEAMSRPLPVTPLLNPSKGSPVNFPINFGVVLSYGDRFLITFSENILYVLNIEELKVERAVLNLRGILDVAICGLEIFILETGRNVVRLAPEPESTSITKRIIRVNHPMWQTDDDEFGAGVTSAEECFESPPDRVPTIERLQDKKRERIQRMERFNRVVSATEDDDTILFKTAKRPKPKSERKVSQTATEPPKVIEEVPPPMALEKEKMEEKSSLTLDLSFHEDSPLEPVPTVLSKEEVEAKEKLLAETLKIEPVKLEKIETIEKDEGVNSIHAEILKTWSSYAAPDPSPSLPELPILRKPYRFEDETPVSDDEKTLLENLSDDMKNCMIRSEFWHPSTIDGVKQLDSMSKSIALVPNAPSPVRKLPDYLNLPNLWSLNIERIRPGEEDDDDIGKDWEIL